MCVCVLVGIISWISKSFEWILTALLLKRLLFLNFYECVCLFKRTRLDPLHFSNKINVSPLKASSFHLPPLNLSSRDKLFFLCHLSISRCDPLMYLRENYNHVLEILYFAQESHFQKHCINLPRASSSLRVIIDFVHYN